MWDYFRNSFVFVLVRDWSVSQWTGSALRTHRNKYTPVCHSWTHTHTNIYALSSYIWSSSWTETHKQQIAQEAALVCDVIYAEVCEWSKTRLWCFLIKWGALSGFRKERGPPTCVCVWMCVCYSWGQVPGALCISAYCLPCCSGDDIIAHDCQTMERIRPHPL